MFQYHLSPVVRGAIFIVGPGVYALMTPVWGWIVDKKVNIVSLFFFSTLVAFSLSLSQRGTVVCGTRLTAGVNLASFSL